ncbi:hypothetical protein ACFSRY_15495 [Pontibacter locisalis]|uniref:DUF1737 domain-containing protein n=1 Tax=Pontibacter locisalis TaxID=1719035 RepID=A0ABW5INR5_9BACT
MEYDMILSDELTVLASAVKTYMRNGWVPKGEVVEYKNNYAQEMERHPVKSAQQKNLKGRQKTWIQWPKV